jgi:hypothetical protein
LAVTEEAQRMKEKLMGNWPQQQNGQKFTFGELSQASKQRKNT